MWPFRMNSSTNAETAAGYQDRTQVSAVERGIYRASNDTISTLASILNVDSALPALKAARLTFHSVAGDHNRIFGKAL